jgi:hypothetical protein
MAKSKRGKNAGKGNGGATGAEKAVAFAKRLIVFRWLLSLFGVETLEALAAPLKAETLLGLDADGIHRFHKVLVQHFHDLPELPEARLLEYDQNIVRHTRTLNDKRLAHGEPAIVWKHYQYLALLFVEIYLDRYFEKLTLTHISFG